MRKSATVRLIDLPKTTQYAKDKKEEKVPHNPSCLLYCVGFFCNSCVYELKALPGLKRQK